MKQRLGNIVKLAFFTALLGGFAGLVVWCFLKAVAFGTYIVWDKLPEASGFPYVTLIICAVGGLITGILHKFFGDYPEELDVVMGKIKTEKHYAYHSMPVMLVCAFFPLVLGASVGPEAGLTGIIAALCYWTADNVTYAKQNTELFSQVGEAVTLGQLFHSPLFGILAVEEGDSDEDSLTGQMSKGNKLLYYGISTASGFLMAWILDQLFGAAMEGFPSFSGFSMEKEDCLMLLAYIPAGLLIYALFELSEKAASVTGKHIPSIIRETLCGIVTGIMGLAFPMVMFSGEEQMGEMMDTFISYSPYILIGICILKIIMTAFCINLGLKGGHFFPLIFACTCLGFAMTLLIFAADPVHHAAFAAASVTATVLGAQMKKPLAASLLLLLCFPVKALLCIFLCAAIGKSVACAVMKEKSDE